MSDCIRIPISRGFFTIIDGDDEELIRQYVWNVSIGVCHNYATAKVQRKETLLHRFLLNAPSNMDVDHRNGDGLDNRRSNLRICTDSQNQANRIKLSKNTSGFRGVCYRKQYRKWEAQIKKDQKTFYLGMYVTREDAARAYDDAARTFFGEFARLNFPENHEQSAAAGGR